MIGTEQNISHQDFFDIIDAISKTESVKELFQCCDKRVSYKYGIYHHIPALGSRDYARLNRFWSTGISSEVLTYLQDKGHTYDPAMEYVFAKGRPYWMSELLEQPDYVTGRQQFRVNLALENVGDGQLFPVYGPYQKQGYIVLGFENPREFFDDIFIWQVQAILQAVHVQYCTLNESLRTKIKLTKRESEVLELITFGKTNPEIGIILGISASTVSGHVKRIFLKFDAKDRVTVALRASRGSVLSDITARRVPKYIHGNAV